MSGRILSGALFGSRPLIAAGALLSLGGTTLPGADLDFYRDIYPSLKTSCISCHNKTTTKGKLNMESPELMKKGGDSGPGLIAGKSAESLIVQAAAHQDPDLIMPPKNNKSGAEDLSPKDLELLKVWIDQGAKHSVQQARNVAWQALPPRVNPIYTVAMTPDARYAACGRGNQIFIYDLATRQLLSRATHEGDAAHRSIVQSLAFSPDGTRLASGSFREVKIWRLEKGAPAAPANPPAAAAAPVDEALLKKLAAAAKVAIVSHAASPDGKLVATGCADGSVRVWNAATAAPVATLRGGVGTNKQVAAHEWTVAAQAVEQAYHKGEATRIEAQNKALDELLKKAKEAIVAMNKALPEKQKLVKPAQDAKAAAQKALADAEALVAKAPDAKPDAALAKQVTDAQAALAKATMAERSAVAAFANVQENIKDAEADVKRITESKAKNATALTTANNALAASKKLQDKATAELAAVRKSIEKGDRKPVAVAFSSNGQKIAALMDDGALRVWATASGTPIEEVASSAGAGKTTLTAGPSGTFLATKSITLGTAPEPKWVLERVLGGDAANSPLVDRVNAVTFSPDGKTLGIGGGEPSRSGDVSLWETATGKLIKNLPERHSDAVVSLDFSPDGKLLASGGADKMARVTDVASGKQVHAFEGHTHHVLGIAFRADGRVLATGGADGVVLVWNMIMGERKKKIDGWVKEVTSLDYVGATSQLVASTGNNLVRIVSDEGGIVRTIDKLPDFMQSAAITADAAIVIGGGEDSFLRVWDAKGKELAAFGAK